MENTIEIYTCEFCNKKFRQKFILNRHQKTSKECIFIRTGEIIPKKTFECKYCSKMLSSNQRLENHIDICKVRKQQRENEIKIKTEHLQNLEITKSIQKTLEKTLEKNIEKDTINNQLIELLMTKNKIIGDLKSQNESVIPLDKDNMIELLKEKDLKLKLSEEKIQLLENLYVKKQRRKDYPEKNVVYIITTQDNKKKRIYIIGKAKELKNRLSTYNKTSEHEVIYYKECNSEEEMKAVEIMVLTKLENYREQANRDRFVLPIDKDISLFISVIEKCVLFFK